MNQQPPEYPQYPQQPQTQYGAPPPPPPGMMPPGPPPKKKFRLPVWAWIIIAIFVLGAIGSMFNRAPDTTTPGTTSSTTTSSTSAAPTDTPTPAATPTPSPTPHPLAWTTVQTFTGNGTRKTAILTVPDDWKILYSCTFQNEGGVTDDGLLSVAVYNADGSVADGSAVFATCKNGVAHTTGETEEHQAGQVYLSVDGTGDWTIQIQVQK